MDPLPSLPQRLTKLQQNMTIYFDTAKFRTLLSPQTSFMVPFIATLTSQPSPTSLINPQQPLIFISTILRLKILSKWILKYVNFGNGWVFVPTQHNCLESHLHQWHATTFSCFLLDKISSFGYTPLCLVLHPLQNVQGCVIIFGYYTQECYECLFVGFCLNVHFPLSGINAQEYNLQVILELCDQFGLFFLRNF